MFNGFRIGIAVAVIGALVGKFVSANAGLGYLVVRSKSDFNYMAVPTICGVLTLIGPDGAPAASRMVAGNPSDRESDVEHKDINFSDPTLEFVEIELGEHRQAIIKRRAKALQIIDQGTRAVPHSRPKVRCRAAESRT